MAVPDLNDIEAFMTEAGGGASEDAEAVAAEAGRDAPEVIAVDSAAGSMKHCLLVPLMVDGVRLSEVTMRMATLGDIDDWGSGALASNRDLLARLTGLHPAVLRGLRHVDSDAVIRMFEAAVPAFVIDGIERGQTS